MNWDDLRVVATINRTGSFTRAAALLEVDETTISRRLARIEATLGITLFAASHGRREPTEDCRRILRHLAVMEQASEEIGAILTAPSAAQRRLRLSTIGAIAHFYLAPALPELLEAEGELALSIDISDHNIAMSRWEADFALRLGRPSRGDFTVRRIGMLQFALVRPSDPDVSPLLVAYPEVLMETPEMQALRSLLGDIRPRLETSDLGLTRRFLASGRGIGVVPDRLARTLAGNPALEIEPLEVTRDVWLLSQPHLRDDSLARSVSEWCTRQFASMPPQSKV
ncbi:LysR family transcriptional regulator [Paracoccus niistensis]|uniref:LysR family transcriptional regulator n=1 Tax=Paracoccus niistensis TaxID=632935 RepID=A0ABV6I3P1_9RHOB